jgi:hypothetical protein
MGKASEPANQTLKLTGTAISVLLGVKALQAALAS